MSLESKHENKITDLPDAILFDWDGTLVDSYGFLEQGHNHVLGLLGRSALEDGEYRRYFGQPRDQIYLDIYEHQAEEAKTLFEKFVEDNHASLVREMQGAGILLREIYKMQIPMGIVSNKITAFIEKEFSVLGWKSFFQTVIGAGEAEADKPSPAPLLMAAEKMGFGGSVSRNIWYIGDTENDVRAAQAAGFMAVYIDPDFQTHKWLQQYKPVETFMSCEVFQDFLLQCQQKQLKRTENAAFKP